MAKKVKVEKVVEVCEKDNNPVVMLAEAIIMHFGEINEVREVINKFKKVKSSLVSNTITIPGLH